MGFNGNKLRNFVHDYHLKIEDGSQIPLNFAPEDLAEIAYDSSFNSHCVPARVTEVFLRKFPTESKVKVDLLDDIAASNPMNGAPSRAESAGRSAMLQSGSGRVAKLKGWKDNFHTNS